MSTKPKMPQVPFKRSKGKAEGVYYELFAAACELPGGPSIVISASTLKDLERAWGILLTHFPIDMTRANKVQIFSA